VRSGAVAIDRWSPPKESGGIDYSRDWKAL
jgi:hypothetical protein